MSRAFKFLFIVSLFVLGSLQIVAAQGTGLKSFETKMRATSEISGLAGKTKIIFWGIEAIESADATLKIRARTALDNVIGDKKVECNLKVKKVGALVAQCVNHQELDLGLFMLQNGYVTADRMAVYGTVFEGPYLQAEADAQSNEIGVWGGQKEVEEKDSNLMLSLGFFLFMFVTAAFAVLSMFIMRGFQKVIDAQNKNMEMTAKERVLRDKERQIFATMLDSEIKANKSKIEAYLIVYDEMLKALQDPEKPPKYQAAGDIVQEQPALSRAVFDRNTDKLDVLGDQLSSEVIHFYARIKSKAEYINLEPEMSLEDVIEVVEHSLQNGKTLNKVSDRLIDLFSQGGLSSEDY